MTKEKYAITAIDLISKLRKEIKKDFFDRTVDHLIKSWDNKNWKKKVKK